MATSYFSDLLATITERGRALLARRDWLDWRSGETGDPVEARSRLSEALLSGRGEASGTAMASEAIGRLNALDAAGRVAFLHALARAFGPDPARLAAAVAAWQAEPTDARAQALHYASEPRRQELFRRLNRAPGGTAALVDLRAHMQEAAREDQAIAAVDRDLAHLLASWFNRGFLVLRRIDWSSPASVLEKIIRYEAVHEIRDWRDLRHRIDPPDRRCYAFFHPALPDEPLIFVEVALTQDMPAAIAPLLDEARAPIPAGEAKTAVFYSISNCQQGLSGISFGNFLIKQVVEDLRRDLPRLDTFVTLSPVPAFLRWLRTDGGEAALAAEIGDGAWAGDAAVAERLKKRLEPLAARYLIAARAANGRPFDPVARFHLGNGARLERLNWLADRSPRGLTEAAGFMVNYLYDLDSIEKNHEAFAERGEVIAAAPLKKLAAAPSPVSAVS